MRLLFAAALTLGVAVAASGGAAQSIDEPLVLTPHIRLVVPQPGKVAVEVVRVRVSGDERGRVVPPHFVRLVGARRGVSALVVRRARHADATDTYTLLAIVVNRPGRRTVARARPSAQDPKKTVEFREDIPWHLYAIAKDIPRPVVVDAGPYVAVKLDTTVAAVRDVDKASPAAWRNVTATAGFTGSLAASDLDTGHYDDGHAFGWTKSRDRAPVSAFALMRKLLASKPAPAAAAAIAKQVEGVPPRTADPPPPLSVDAAFDPTRRQTVYDLVDEDGRVFTPPRPRSFLWTLYIPRNDLRCHNRWQFYGYGAAFAWYHGDDLCDHAKEDARGHRGSVVVTYTMLGWHCRARYDGTVSGRGNPAACRLR